jgi:transcriptional regulator GlxA family with amidase domain
VFDGMLVFEYAVAAEVWGIDRTARGVPAFELVVCGRPGTRPRLGQGLMCLPEHPLSTLTECDLVVVPGIADIHASVPADALTALQTAHEAGATLVSLCSGAFVLAAAGILDGRKATAHWLDVDELARRYPAVAVDPKVLFVGDGSVWTSAGTAAGIDLCLHLIREDHGAAVAAEVARTMVTAPFRNGGQAQFITTPGPVDNTESDMVTDLHARILADPAHPWTVTEMAAFAHVSERTFARHFVRTTNTTPLQWLLTQRVLAAQQLLETSDLSVAAIARRTGFGSTLSLRQHFTRHLGLPPRDYRATFRGRIGSDR